MQIIGISWLRETSYGTACTGLRGEHDGLRDLYQTLRARTVLPEALKDFGRFDPESKRVCLCAALALHDAALAPHGPEMSEAGILITGAEGAHHANLAYFRDYLAGGRSLGRGNLFIYTLPTSPAAETAIAFGMHGPLLYSGRRIANGSHALNAAARLIAAGQADVMLCVLPDRDAVACYLLGAGKRRDRPGLPVRDVVAASGDSAALEKPWERSGFPKGWI